MTLDVNGFGTTPMATSVPEPLPTQPVAAPAAMAPIAPPQDNPGASVQPEPTAPPTTAAQPRIEAFGRTFENAQQLEAYTRHVIRSAEGRIRAEAASQGTQAPQPAVNQPPAPPQAPPEPQGAYDVETFVLIKTRFGEEAAEDYRSKAIAEHHQKTTQALLDKTLAPMREREEVESFQAEITSMFQRAESAAGSNGQPLIPELKSQPAAEAIVKIWQEFPIEYARTPVSILRAAQIYRGQVMQMVAPTPPPPQNAPSGQSLDSSVGPPSGFVPGIQPPSNIPRPSTVHPVTGERYTIQ